MRWLYLGGAMSQVEPVESASTCKGVTSLAGSKWRRERFALLVAAMMIAEPAAASDFSGFFTLFIGTPLFALIILLFCILLCDKRIRRVKFKAISISMLMLGALPLMRWLWIFPWPLFAASLTLMASVIGMLGLPSGLRVKARKGMAWLLLSAAALTLLLAIAEMLLLVARDGKREALVVVAIAIGLFGPAILIFRSVVRAEAGPE